MVIDYNKYLGIDLNKYIGYKTLTQRMSVLQCSKKIETN